ncbi:helix-turn-helix transcriptional regulator [Ascidiaceihabitans sp.]|uniref:helix-turn-helix transcriptional regulator n=1 Tax=Ascidiaceihabitans sp. TaxID=1872644 RepID=UPI00329971C9
MTQNLEIQQSETDREVDGGETLIMRLAGRVRAVRKELGMPRRELSERSGVSPRYLAQLESGEGNISVLLLQRVAAALNTRIEDLLSDTGDTTREARQIAQLYQNAGSETQGKVRRMLVVQNPHALRAQRVCLIGLRGAGKSTLGQKSAAALNIPFVELKSEIERRVGMPASEIMELYGQDGYRAMESEAIEAVVSAHDRLIMSVGGGIVAQSKTFSLLKTYFHTIWVRTSPAEHMARVRAQGDLRPMEGNPEAMEQLKALLAARSHLYETALAQVDTSNRPQQSSVNDVLATIAKHRFIEQRGP